MTDVPLNQDMWETAQSQLRPAMDAFEQQHKAGLKMLTLIGCDRHDDELLLKVCLGCTYMDLLICDVFQYM